jgi:hypothetical protein
MEATFGPKSKEVTGDQRILYSDELHGFTPSPYLVLVNKSRRMRWVGHVTYVGGREMLIGF